MKVMGFQNWSMMIIIEGNYSGMLIGRPIVILYFMARKITAEGAEVRRVVNRLCPLRVPLRTLRLNSRFGYSTPHVIGSSCIVKFPIVVLGT
uniref:Uncharacterized protein n=1 Tax=Candidatus Methanogaster sp. ANME-2c ERB4 TaxID=2759911 RepID=A0A7G9YHR9_9EURY|nr:hypothetical protein GGGHDLIA_00043 [Methanosarcinales archaeon ANME-2c ERB4]